MTKILIASHHTNNKGDEAAINGVIRSLKDLTWDAEFTVLADYPEIASTYLNKKYIQVLGWTVRRDEWYPLSVRLDRFPKMVQIVIEMSFMLRSIFNMFLGLLWLSLSSEGLDIPLLKEEKRKVLEEFRDADIVLFSPGGPYLGDLAGLWLPVHLYHMLVAQILRKPIMIYAPSIGPFKRTKWICKRFLKGVQVITIREPVSMSFLKELDLPWPPLSYLTADCALLQEPADERSVERIMHSLKIPSDNSLLVGITVKGERFVDQQRMWMNYTKALASVADYLITKYNAIIIFIPHVYGAVSEINVIKEVISMMSPSDRIRILPENCRAGESQGVLAKLNLLIATRLHSLVLATAVGTLGVSIAYEHKAIGFAEMLGLSEFVLNIDTLDSYELSSKIDKLLKNSEQLKAQIASKIPNLRKLAMLNAKLATKLLQCNYARS